jgi:hypothetical protein
MLSNAITFAIGYSNSDISAAELVSLPPHMFVPPSRDTNCTKVKKKKILIRINVNGTTNISNFIKFRLPIFQFKTFGRTDLWPSLHKRSCEAKSAWQLQGRYRIRTESRTPDRPSHVHSDTHHSFSWNCAADGVKELRWHKNLNTLQFSAQLGLSGTAITCGSAWLSRYNRILYYSGVFCRVSNLRWAFKFHLKFHYHFCVLSVWRKDPAQF